VGLDGNFGDGGEVLGSLLKMEIEGSECLDAMLWPRRQNSTSKCLESETQGRLQSWIGRVHDPSLEWFEFDEREERQDIEPDVEYRRLWLWEKKWI